MRVVIRIALALMLIISATGLVANDELDVQNVVVYKLRHSKAGATEASAKAESLESVRGYKAFRLHPESENNIADQSDADKWYLVKFKNRREAEEALKNLRSRGDIESCFLSPKAYPAGFQGKLKAVAEADLFQEQQRYHLPAPQGFDSLYAWTLPGGNGKGVTLVDIEGDWDKKHTDLKLKKIKIRGRRAGISSSWFSHGTAVAGIINGKKNRYGVTGIAWKAKLKLNSIFRKDANGGLYSSVANSIYTAANRLKAGDIILIEVQFGGLKSSGDYIPVEYYQDCFEAIQYAVAKGIVVVEAAGNGGQNLDDPIYEEHFDVDVRGDSGAIMVGAGGAPKSAYPYKTNKNNNRVKLWFSNYGKRIDLQNWGEYVVSTGYGDLQNAGPGKTYTSSFSGTSSASALTAGLCASLQGVAKELLGRPLTPAEMRSLLKETGDSQRGGTSKGRIGPRPDMKKAIEAIESGEFFR